MVGAKQGYTYKDYERDRNKREEQVRPYKKEIAELQADLDAARKEVKRLDAERLSFHAQATEYYEQVERRGELLRLAWGYVRQELHRSRQFPPVDEQAEKIDTDIRTALGRGEPVCDGCKLDGDCPAQRGEAAMGPDVKCIHRERSDDGGD